jgi:homotetrameric cytidine deaminase
MILPIEDSKIETVTVDSSTLQTLLAVRARAYAPWSDFHVAALIECPDGSRFVGCNVETSHFKSICAEAAAISAMVAAGQRQIRRVWIVADGQACCPPCGDCRQRLFEFADPDCEVLLVDESAGSARRWRMSELLPDAFRFAAGPGKSSS